MNMAAGAASAHFPPQIIRSNGWNTTARPMVAGAATMASARAERIAAAC